ncbi:MAG: DNA methylase [Acidobacteria bacterium]|nr:DNA methylase [Acidobacteriota bacterium]
MTSSLFRLINGDCIDVLRGARPERVDLVITDPPYVVNYRDRTGRRIANDNAADWIEPAFRQIARVLKPDGYCISFYGWNRADQFLAAWRRCGLFPVGHFVWAKSYASSRRLVRATHECAYLLAKRHPRRPTVLLNDVLPWSYTGNRLHPTQKPVSALEPLIAAFSDPGDLVLDPFMGSGSTGAAALQQGRRFVGVELDAGYCAVAEKRLRQFGAA